MEACCPRCRCKRFDVSLSERTEHILLEICTCDSCGTRFELTFDCALIKCERADDEL